jgi:glycogen debranching enzyme
MEHDLVVLDGSTFAASPESGDMHPDAMDGFFHSDTRHLSEWSLLANGEPLLHLTSRNLEYYACRIVGVVAGTEKEGVPSITVLRDRFVRDGMHEDLFVENNSEEEAEVTLEIRYAADFIDIPSIRTAGDVERCDVEVRPVEAGVDFRCRRDGHERATHVRFSVTPDSVDEERASFRLRIAARGTWRMCIEVVSCIDDEQHGAGHEETHGAVQPRMDESLDEWMEGAPQLETEWVELHRVYRKSLLDLAALRFRPRDDLEHSLPAGGLPWYMALFGRDSLITAYQALPFQPRLARTALYMLAELQGTRIDDFHDEEPGKILHELRHDLATAVGILPFDAYYGGHDQTLLWLILLDEYERWTGDADCARGLEEPARRALTGLEEHADLDGDGFFEYHCRSERGLFNQCWKDSDDSMRFADGRVAEPPIAACEVQGYAYDALRRTARMMRVVWGDERRAEELEGRADDLRRRFDETFWDDEKGIYVLALDGEKRRVDSATSNMGHLLWSGIVPEGRAGRVVERLLQDDLWSGWGVRTMSSDDAGYDPIGYHIGSVWPHDTSLVAEGMRRYGYRREATLVARAVVEAGAAFDDRLPEVFAGFARDVTEMPVWYPGASRPQAWAAGAVLLGLRTMLGLDAVDGELRFEPVMPDGRRIVLRGVPLRDDRRDAGSE